MLVACEASGRVRDAFLAKGHDAISLDILPTDVPGPHRQEKLTQRVLNEGWDLIIGFPPCTHLANIGVASWKQKQADGRQQAAINFFKRIYNAKCPKIAVENPAGILSTVFRKPDQYVQPWWFGDPYTKRTGLWLRGLPKLVPTNIVEPTARWVNGGKCAPRINGTGAETSIYGISNNSKKSGTTFPGVAKAMAEQWG